MVIPNLQNLSLSEMEMLVVPQMFKFHWKQSKNTLQPDNRCLLKNCINWKKIKSNFWSRRKTMLKQNYLLILLNIFSIKIIMNQQKIKQMKSREWLKTTIINKQWNSTHLWGLMNPNKALSHQWINLLFKIQIGK